MNAHTAANGRVTSLASGVAVTALVVVVGVAVAIADLSPAAPEAGAERTVAPVVAATEADGPRVPDELKVNAAEVPPHVEAF